MFIPPVMPNLFRHPLLLVHSLFFCEAFVVIRLNIKTW